MKKQNIILDRKEVAWLARKLKLGLKKAEGTMNLLNGRNDLSAGEKDELRAAQEAGPFLLHLSRLFEQFLDQGAKERFGMEHRRAELNSVIELADEPEAKAFAEKELEAIPKDEEYKLQADRKMVKFFIKVIGDDIQNIRSVTIPTYEKAPDEDFPSPAMTRSYYINKARKTKEMLEVLFEKFERTL